MRNHIETRKGAQEQTWRLATSHRRANPTAVLWFNLQLCPRATRPCQWVSHQQLLFMTTWDDFFQTAARCFRPGTQIRIRAFFNLHAPTAWWARELSIHYCCQVAPWTQRKRRAETLLFGSFLMNGRHAYAHHHPTNKVKNVRSPFNTKNEHVGECTVQLKKRARATLTHLVGYKQKGEVTPSARFAHTQHRFQKQIVNALVNWHYANQQ